MNLTYTETILFVIGMWQIVVGTVAKTKQISGFVLFKIIPVVSGVFCMLCALNKLP